ncbi:DUF72 domain-containing protein [Actinophytocola sediminis]
MIGTSGWVYPPWRGEFYPPGLAQRRELEHLSGRLNSVELNGSFYSLQRPASYQSWHAQTPDGFVFAVKGSRFITHLKRLRDTEVPLANFLASGVLALGDKLGPILWQLPPNLPYDPDAIADFCAALPRTTTEAAELATHHDERVDGRALTTAPVHAPLRHALEVRHPSFTDPTLPDLLRAHDVALVIADAAADWPALDHVTSDFVYARLHGSTELYTSGYPDQDLDDWATRIRTWTADGLDVHVYFDNDAKVRAPVDAAALTQRLDLPWPP